MTLSINQAQINAAAGSNQALRETLTAMMLAHQSTWAQAGTGPIKKVDASTPPASPAPQHSTLSAVGANGQITVSITLPQQTVGAPLNPGKATIYQEISTSTASNFSTVLQTYPLTTANSLTIAAPGQTLYIRLRSTSDQRTFTIPQIIGPISAGLMTSAATQPNLSLNQGNFARIDSVGAGGTATIRVYGPGGVNTSWPSITGTNSKVIPAGTILGITYGTTKFVAWDGQKYQVVPSLTQAFPDGWIPVGSVSVVSNGAGLVLPTIAAVRSSGSIIAYNVTAGGNGITGALSFVIADSGGGTGATVGAANVSGGVLQSLAPGNPGSGYTAATTVTASGGVSGGVAGGGGPAGSNAGRLFGLTQNGV